MKMIHCKSKCCQSRAARPGSHFAESAGHMNIISIVTLTFRCREGLNEAEEVLHSNVNLLVGGTLHAVDFLQEADGVLCKAHQTFRISHQSNPVPMNFLRRRRCRLLRHRIRTIRTHEEQGRLSPCSSSF